jgi:uncharacterized membrane protein HdeD (DUF308 family)
MRWADIITQARNKEPDIVSQLETVSAVGATHDERASMHSQWWIFLTLGLVSVFVGFVAISSTFIATLATVMVFGVLLLITGFTELIHAVLVRNLKGFALHLLAAALYLIAGVFMLENPLWTAEVLTFMLAACFFVGGIFRTTFALVLRFPAWPWVLVQGVIDVILGILILRGWPETSLWVIGLFVGIDMVFHGWSWVILGLNLRTWAPAPSV